MNQFISNKEEEFGKAFEFFKKEIAQIRTGRANPAILEGVQVEAYGAKTPLQGVATINVPDSQNIVVAPWDKNVIKDVEKAIVEAELGVGVVNEGERIRLTIPKMTEENRKELVRKLNEKHEAMRVRLRQIREEIKEAIEAAERDKEINEDDKFRFIRELDEEMKKKNDELKEVRDKKEEDVMTI